MRVYVATSWRNIYQPSVVNALEKEGHEVYYFRHPSNDSNGFYWSDIDKGYKTWSDIDKGYKTWTPSEYIKMLRHPLSKEGFRQDFSHLEWCEACVYVTPCGVSASLEAGWIAGSGRLLICYIPEVREPDLVVEALEMVKMSDLITDDINDVIKRLAFSLNK
jgi:hypothetical protein